MTANCNEFAKELVDLEKEKTYSPNDIAKMFDFSMSHVYRLIKKGHLKTTPVKQPSPHNKKYVITQSDLENFKRNHHFKEYPKHIKVVQGKPIRIDNLKTYFKTRLNPKPPKFLDTDEREVWLNGWRAARNEIITLLSN